MRWYVIHEDPLYRQFPRESDAKTRLHDVGWTFKIEHALTFPDQKLAEEWAAYLQLLNPRARGPLVVRSEQELIEQLLTKEQSPQ